MRIFATPDSYANQALQLNDQTFEVVADFTFFAYIILPNGQATDDVKRSLTLPKWRFYNCTKLATEGDQSPNQTLDF